VERLVHVTNLAIAESAHVAADRQAAAQWRRAAGRNSDRKYQDSIQGAEATEA